MNEYVRSNRDLWDELTVINAASEFYDVPGFMGGTSTLLPLEVEELGDVTGKSLLHLQCHFGLDTLSWARRGAVVTGVDFSHRAIDLAIRIAREVGIDARFVCSDLYDAPAVLQGAFDVVFTSAGVLCWLPDLAEWAKVVAHFVRPGGLFYLREFHPLAGMFDDTIGSGPPQLRHPYFPQDAPLRFEPDGSYADPSAVVTAPSHEWPHSLSEIVSFLIDAGLTVEFLHEFPFTTYRSHGFLQQDPDGLWRYPGLPSGLPLMFSVRGIKTSR
ncbi:class I SAM-dependent methyltransferase [Candidatus Fermentibacteria bacterium]|nr:class I SAM-dependent methyltransferase [Candidatus Fermentibacteria bacterium]